MRDYIHVEVIGIQNFGVAVAMLDHAVDSGHLKLPNF